MSHPDASRSWLAALATTLVLSACGGGSGVDATALAGNVPLVYAKRVNTVGLDPLTGASFAAGGDLMLRLASSPSAPEVNLTGAITQGVGDVADPEVSYDGRKVVFAMNCPASNTSKITQGGATVSACTGRWNIWEYDTSNGLSTGTFRRITNSTSADDVGPAYLPAGAGFVFSSNRQVISSVNQALGRSYVALDEYERQQVFNLHTMAADGSAITQISFNQSHDRNPVVRPDGTIMFSRWEHVADRNRFTIFKVNPDGTNMFVLYGAHADGNSFLHPRDMDPAGPYAGQISSDLMALDRTHGGGALMIIDAAHYADQNNPVATGVASTGGQAQATTQSLNTGLGPSLYGRVTTPYPLWDGTGRFLVSFAPCEVNNAGVVVACSTLSATELAALSDSNRLTSAIQADPIKDNVPPGYAVYMFDPGNQSWTLVAAPASGYMYTDPIPLQARAEPSAFTSTVTSPALAAQHMATLTVASVFDTDLLGRMGQGMLSQADVPAQCTSAGSTLTTAVNAMIPQTAPLDPQDTRATVADILALKDPANPAYLCSPVRFIRAIRAVAPPASATGVRQAIGNTNFEQSQILGYAVVEPDGSFQINIPADTPVAFAVLDAQGRAFQVHTNWIQARPGEVRSCDGCHSPRKGAAINSGSIVNAVPAAWSAAMVSARQTGFTMAQIRANAWAIANGDINPLHNPVYQLQPDPVYQDVWAANAAQARPSIQSTYAALTTTAPATAGATSTAPLAGIINYTEHIQPLWTVARGANGSQTCVNCHNASDVNLNLSATIAGTGRLTSYESLTTGAPVLVNGQPVIQVTNGVAQIQTGPALIATRASDSETVGLARQSRMIEILSGQIIMSDAASRTAYPAPALNHAGMLNASEMRLLIEWVDLGGKYFNDPFNGSANVSVSALSQTVYASTIHPILMSTCAASCHQALGSGGTVPAGTSFSDNKFVLTGDPVGDYNNTLSMISNVCTPADPSNFLLSQPSAVPHPAAATGQTTAVLPVSGANYSAIAAWIQSGCP